MTGTFPQNPATVVSSSVRIHFGIKCSKMYSMHCIVELAGGNYSNILRI